MTTKLHFYTVSWVVEVDAESPERAAWMAADMAAKVMNPDSLARSFEVVDESGEKTVIDLTEESRVE